MRTIAVTAFLTAAAAATAIGLSSSPALADDTWTVGPSASGSVDFTADSTTSLVLTDNTTGTQLTCTSSTARSSVIFDPAPSNTTTTRSPLMSCSIRIRFSSSSRAR